MELSQASCHSSLPVARVEMPFTPSPSQHSLLFPAFSFPLSFLLPFSCFSQHLHVLLLLSFFSRGFLESSACCGCLAGGRTFSRFLVGLKVPICHPGQNYHLVGLGSAWQTVMLSMRAKFQGQLSMGNFTLLGCFQSNTPSGLSTDAQRQANKWLKREEFGKQAPETCLDCPGEDRSAGRQKGCDLFNFTAKDPPSCLPPQSTKPRRAD